MLNIAIVNLNNLKENAQKIVDKLGKTKLCAVVKADGYGHGANQVANALYPLCSSYAVALVEEGIALRQSGIDKEILVLIPPFLGELERAVSYGLSLAVDDEKLLIFLDKTCEILNKTCKVHLKFNSGMNRLGVNSLMELENLLTISSKLKRVKVAGVFTHYACPENQKSFERATSRFLLAKRLVKSYNKNITLHASASGGFLKGAYFDMVRIGIMLYGYLPFDCDFPLKPAMKVYSPVVKKRIVLKGENYLYGNRQMEKDQKASIIRYGYADGLLRQETIGQLNNRCMDLSMQEGFCKKDYYPIMTSANELAKKYGTIPYEILTKVGTRANKIYIN